MSPLQVQLERIRRRRWLVVVIAGLAVAGSVLFTLRQEATYTGRAALTISSLDRAPDQDAVLAQGYAELFNQASYQQVLRGTAGVDPSIGFSARTAAASPILYVEAVTDDADAASSAAATMAAAFRDDVNANLVADTERSVAALSEQIDTELARLQGVEAPDERTLITQQISSLQDRITDLRANTSNQLKDLQPNAGVLSSTPRPVPNAVLALIGGLVLGAVVALALAALENRVSTPHDVREHLDLDTLAIVRGGSTRAGASTRAQRLKALANVVSLRDLPRPAALAVAAPRATAGSSVVAAGIATYRAVQGESTLLLRADLQRGTPDEAGVADVLSGRARIEDVERYGDVDGLYVVPAGESPDDPYALFARERFDDLVREAHTGADLVVIDAPPLVDAAESQVVCAAADRTVLVVEEGTTHAGDAVEALRLLEQAGAVVLGVVIVDPAAGRAGPGQLARARPRSAAAASRGGREERGAAAGPPADRDAGGPPDAAPGPAEEPAAASAATDGAAADDDPARVRPVTPDRVAAILARADEEPDEPARTDEARTAAGPRPGPGRDGAPSDGGLRARPYSGPAQPRTAAAPTARAPVPTGRRPGEAGGEPARPRPAPAVDAATQRISLPPEGGTGGGPAVGGPAPPRQERPPGRPVQPAQRTDDPVRGR